MQISLTGSSISPGPVFHTFILTMMMPLLTSWEYTRLAADMQNMRMLRRFLDHEAVEVTPLGEVTADRYSRIVMQLKKDGRPIPINDVWIAAQAMEHGAELLTTDRHFEQVAGLACTIY